MNHKITAARSIAQFCLKSRLIAGGLDHEVKVIPLKEQTQNCDVKLAINFKKRLVKIKKIRNG